MEWNPMNIIPPDQMLLVVDAAGNTARAYPCYYPFKVVENPNKTGKWTSDVIHCDPYWDGNWLIEIGISDNPIGIVVGWKHL